MSAGKLDLYVEQGTTFKREIVLSVGSVTPLPIDITDWIFSGQIRKNYSDATILATFAFTITDAIEGQFLMELTNVETSAIPVTKAASAARKNTQYIYDVEATKPDGSVIRVLEGAANVSPEVTRV